MNNLRQVTVQGCRARSQSLDRKSKFNALPIAPLLIHININTQFTLHVSLRKKKPNFFCNISYKAWATSMKFGTPFAEKICYKRIRYNIIIIIVVVVVVVVFVVANIFCQ